MADRLSTERRSANMRQIRSKNTQPEKLIRSIAHLLGYRYRLHVKDLPGKPDLVFPRLHCVIQVHGCFWHVHKGCREGRIPETRREYWEAKLLRNVERDRAHLRELRRQGWRVLIVWECQTGNLKRLENRIKKFLGSMRQN